MSDPALVIIACATGSCAVSLLLLLRVARQLLAVARRHDAARRWAWGSPAQP